MRAGVKASAPPRMTTSYELAQGGTGAGDSRMTVGGASTSESHSSRQARSARRSASGAWPPGTLCDTRVELSTGCCGAELKPGR